MRPRRAIMPIALALSLAAFSTASAAQEAPAVKQTPPPPKPATKIHFPPFEQRTLPNGLRLVVIEQHETPSLSLQLLVPGGKVYVPMAKAGLAEATAALLREGTRSRSAQQIADAIDRVGGTLDSNASLESAFVHVQLTSDQLDFGLGLLSDVVLSPTFPAEEMERWRGQALSNLQIQESSPTYLAEEVFERKVFGDHPYGQPSSGTAQSVQGLTRDDVAAFHQRQYVPNGSILAIVGDVKAAEAFAKAETAFGGWKKGAEPVIPPVGTAQTAQRIVVVDAPDAVQTEIRVGQLGIAYRDPDHFTALIYDAVLGSSPSSRLYDEIRRKRGLSYGAGSEVRMPSQPGYVLASTFTKTESTVETLGLVLDVFKGMDDQPVPAEELAQRKTYITGAFPLEIETPDGIAAKVLEAMKFGYGREYLESYRDRLDAVTAKDIQTFAEKRIQPDRMLTVLVGNAKAFAADLEKRFGKPEVIPLAELDLLQPDLRKKAEEPKK